MLYTAFQNRESLPQSSGSSLPQHGKSNNDTLLQSRLQMCYKNASKLNIILITIERTSDAVLLRSPDSFIKIAPPFARKGFRFVGILIADCMMQQQLLKPLYRTIVAC